MDLNEVWLLCVSEVFRFSFIDLLNNSVFITTDDPKI